MSGFSEDPMHERQRLSTSEQMAALTASFRMFIDIQNQRDEDAKEYREAMTRATREIERTLRDQAEELRRQSARITVLEPFVVWAKEKRGLVLGVILTVSTLWAIVIGVVAMMKERILGALGF